MYVKYNLWTSRYMGVNQLFIIGECHKNQDVLYLFAPVRT